MSTEDAINAFRDEGWTFNRFIDNSDVEGFLQEVANLDSQQFMVDIHVKDLLIFHPSTTLYNHDCCLSGYVFLQEKVIDPLLFTY